MREIAVVTLLMFFTQIAFSQSYIPTISKFTTKDGLSSDKISALHKDARGFIWVGTDEGLNRFDGKEFKLYSPDNQSDITIRSIHEIFEDEDGFLWLLKKNENYDPDYKHPEINLLNIFTGEITTPEKRFGTSLPFQVNNISYMKMLADGQLYFYCESLYKIFSYSPSKGFNSFSIPSKITGISEMLLQRDGNFLIKGWTNELGSWSIFKINKIGKILTQESFNLQFNLKERDDSLSIGFQGSNLYKLGNNLEAYNYFSPNLTFQKESPKTPAEEIDQTNWNEHQQLFWLKSNSQIRVVQSDGNVVFQRKEKFGDEGIPILFDENTTWYSNKKEGLTAIHLQPNYFKNFKFFEKVLKNSIRGIYQDDKETIWLSTLGGNVKIRLNNKITIESDIDQDFTRFLKDSAGNLWYFAKGGLVKYQIRMQKESIYPFKETSFESWSLLEVNENEFWLSGQHGLLLKFNPKTGLFSKKIIIPSDTNLAFHIYEWLKREDGKYWACTNQGLYLLEENGATVAIYNKKQKAKFYLPTRAVHHIYQDETGIIWVATGDAGLLKLKNNDGKLIVEKQFTNENGLSSNSLHAIYEDDDDYLWISSDNGLIQFDKKTEKIYKYFTDDGLPHNEFNRIAHFKSDDGQIYFGGLLGLVTFHPKHFAKVRNLKNTLPLAITAFQQFSGEEEKFIDRTAELLQTNMMILQPDDQFFNLKVALLDFQEESKATYHYRINGLYDWQNTNNGNLSISGLPYGNHLLEIKAQDESQHEAVNSLAIQIKVLRPFYLQWWFLLLVLGALGSATFYFIRWRTKQMMIFQETKQLRQLDKMKSQFFANISHELRTPLTLILGPLSQLLQQEDLQGKYKSQIGMVHQNGENLLSLVNEVLDLSKLEANKLELHCTATKIPQFLERIVANFESVAKIKSIEYQFMTFLQKDIVALFDQEKLEKILNNLLSNALKFTSKNGMIQIVVGQMGQDLIVKIKDDGKGIPAAELPFIFDRYFQSKNNQMSGGTGIGLALTKELVELMDGEILVQSENNEGTEFEIKLPIKLVENDLKIDGLIENSNFLGFQKLQNFKASETSTEKDTILLVEDNPSLQQFIQSILAQHYNVIVTNNGIEALEELENHSLSLILSDVMMPEMDGFTLLEKVKADDRFCSLPFILLTARADINDKLKGLRIGVDDYMTKPFEVEELLLRVKNLLGNSKNRIVEIPYQKILPKIESQTPKAESKFPNKGTVNHQPTIIDLDWLAKVETIAKREVRNSKYSVENLAYEMHMSRSQLYRKLKQTSGLTPNRYFRNVKLHQAKNILENEEVYTLTEIAYAVGFENISHFVKLYQEAFGKRPHEYLKKESV